MFVIWKALNFRRRYPDLFLKGEYVPLRPVGLRSQQVIAFMRVHHNQKVLILSGRFFPTLLPDVPQGELRADIWGDTGILFPPSERDLGDLTDLFTRRRVRILPSAGELRLAVSDLMTPLGMTILTNLSIDSGSRDD